MLGRRTGGPAERRKADPLSEAKGPKFLMASLGQYVRRIAGMPDYECHVEHMRRCHPEQPIPTQRQFYEEYLKLRYEQGPTRCC